MDMLETRNASRNRNRRILNQLRSRCRKRSDDTKLAALEVFNFYDRYNQLDAKHMALAKVLGYLTNVTIITEDFIEPSSFNDSEYGAMLVRASNRINEVTDD